MKQSFRFFRAFAILQRRCLTLASALMLGGVVSPILSACGQRGPLYLPPPVAPTKASGQATQPGKSGDASSQPRLPAKADGGVKNAPSNDNNFTTPTH